MQCPFCSHQETKVLESREVDESIRRRRECLKCENRFTTYEKAIFHFSVQKKDGREQVYNLDKIKNSLVKSCGKIEDTELAELTRKIEQTILSRKLNPIPTTKIGKIVLKELMKFDKMAYLRFATIHKSIDDPRLLKKELEIIV